MAERTYLLGTIECLSCSSRDLVRHMPCARNEYEGDPSNIEEETLQSGLTLQWCDQGDVVNGYPCVSTHEYQDDEWFVCRRCHAYHLRCGECQRKHPEVVRMCKFVAHCGMDKSKTIEVRAPTPRALSTVPWATTQYLIDISELIERHEKDGGECKVERFDDPRIVERFSEDYASLVRRSHTFDGVYYYLGDRDMYHASGDLVFITGPDGGYVHTWRCTNCDRTYQPSDK